MPLLHAIVLGIVQGLTEFLPISSSAHLIIIPWILGWDDGGLTFDVALHAGTLVAVVLFFFRDWVQIIAQGFDEAVVRRVLKLVRMAEFKRKQAAPVLKVTSRAFGTGWRMPIVRQE